MENTVLLYDSAEDILTASKLIRKGNVVAVKKIFKAKGRPADNPLIVHIYKIEEADKLGHDIPNIFYRLAAIFWPGPLTMIVPKNDIIPAETSGGLDTVGIRMPSHRVMRELIRLTGPIAAPSANRSGYPSPTSAAHVMNDMNGKISAVIDGGESRFGVESTVISFDDENTVRILRPGSVTSEMLMEHADNVIIDDAILNDIAAGREAPSPGMKYKHYSPQADVKIIDGDFENFCIYVNNNQGINTFCLLFDDDDTNKINCRYVTYGSDSSQQAHNFFAKLRELDSLNADRIFVRPPQKDGVGLAVYNRLLRAAGFEVIRV